MKGLYFCLILILMFSLLFMPLCAFWGTKSTVSSSSDVFRVYITEKAEIEDISAFDYCLGVAANNLESTAHAEVIKAEAVAAYTLALYNKNYSESKNFDFNDSLDGYISTDAMKEKWGEDFNKTYDKFKAAVNTVLGQTVLYENKPINALRHNISVGVTEDAKNLMDGEFPYLISVESAGDLLCDNYLTEKTVALEDFNKQMQTQGLAPTDTPEKFIEKTEKTAVGSVLRIIILDKAFSGEEIKNIFDLPSICFDVTYKDNAFIFSVKGSGNMLGLSRGGAEYMAQNGNTYTEILSWYYPGCTLSIK